MKTNQFLLTAAALLFVTVIAKPSLRVIGGQTAESDQFPYAAAINVQTEDGRHFCSGSFTDNQFIITSASCIYNGIQFSVQLGSVTLTSSDENRVIIESTEKIVHPDFNPQTLENDVGFIKFSANVTLTAHIQNIPWLIGYVDTKSILQILGWGQLSDSSDLSENLQYAEASALSDEDCKSYYGDQISKGMICVGGSSIGRTCPGDNGGPLLQLFEERYYMVGVASFISGNGCESSDPSGYTLIAPHFIWLRSIVWPDENNTLSGDNGAIVFKV